MEKITDKINAKRDIKKSTLNNYLRNIRLLAQRTTGAEFKNIDFLKDYTKVKNELKNISLSTQKTYLASIIVVMDALDADETLLNKYKVLLQDTKSVYNEDLKGREKTAKETGQWVNIKDLEKVLKKLGKEVRERNIGKKETLTRGDMKLLQKLVVASLYLLDNDPRRNVYATMDIVKSTDDIEEGKNYLVVKGRNKKWFMIQDQKSKKFKGPQKIPVNTKLNKILNLWLKYNTSTHLILNSKGNKMNTNQLTKYLNTIFSGTGKKISTTMIRKIFLSNEFGATLTRMEKTAENMGHTTKTAQKNYIKKD
tara:strand:+ start:4623 stop:5552 length:930 start_codon:yes stop_codon:yes gene_type:complete